jgi:hypothetical protein
VVIFTTVPSIFASFGRFRIGVFCELPRLNRNEKKRSKE